MTALQGAYADYNDALDPCNRNSIAIGLANPQDLTADSMTYSHVQTNIWAPRGIEAKSRIAGVVRPVDRGWCQLNPGMSLTNCMGVLQSPYPGPGEIERITVNEDRRWMAPNKCWFSDNFGNTAPDPYC